MAAGADLAVTFAVFVEAFAMVNLHRHADARAIARAMYERSMPRNERFGGAFARCVELWVALYTGEVPEPSRWAPRLWTSPGRSTTTSPLAST